MKKQTALLAIALGASPALLGCGTAPDYCSRDLDPPTPAMIQATIEGAEVEKEFDVRVSGESQKVECVVVRGAGDVYRWDDQTDDA